LVASAGVELLVVVGGQPMRALADAAIAAGLPPAAVLSFTTSDDASDEIGRLVRPGDVVLVKGSRGIRTDRVVDRLAAELG
jgi:UDP-N-acetylmuramoyl-tripeptide--D-alanyl-D-alanine ligase